MAAAFGKLRGGVAARIVGAGLALAIGAAAAGCGGEPDGYDPALRYPARADAIVLQLPADPPTRATEAGKLDESLAGLAAVGGRAADPGRLLESDRQSLQRTLDDGFGTPAAPTVPAEVAIADPHLASEELTRGGRLYRQKCAYCHGLTGDGRGPTGVWLVPAPRDFRAGVFKTGASATGGKPTPAAVARVVRAGVPGTSMPPFDLLPDADVTAIVSYIVHLSLRGETELRVLAGTLDESGNTEPVSALAATARAWGQWQTSAATNDPAVGANLGSSDGDAVRRGHAMFTGSAGCASCHTDYGRSDQYSYDVWGAAVRVPDLTRGEHRWGREPADLARRVRAGIPGAGMPASPGLTDDQVRDVVAFLQALPAPSRLPADVRGRIYPGAAGATP